MKRHYSILLALALMLPAHAARKREPVPPFGMVVHSIKASVEDQRAILELCKRAGVKLVRDEIHWDRVEREKGVLRIDNEVTQNVESMLRAGIEPVIVLGYSNPLYDVGSTPVSKEGIEGFARYCEFMARTFKGRITYWEVWNEPNAQASWRSEPDPKHYSKLLKAAYKACKNGNSGCTVIGTCTAGMDFGFIEAVLKEGSAKYMDALSVHPDSDPNGPWEADMVRDLVKLRELMDKHGAKAKRIWITDIGAPADSGATRVAPDVQANMLTRAYLEAISAGVETIFWHPLGEDGPGSTDGENRFGLRFADDSLKPAYYAYLAMTRSLGDAKFDRSMWTGKAIRAHVFTKDDSEVAAMWCVDGVQTISLVVGEDQVVVFDGLSTEGVALNPANGIVSFTLTELPCYAIKKGRIDAAALVPAGVYQFTPPQASIPAGETHSIGVQVANPGPEAVTGRVRILSEKVAPDTHDFTVQPGKRALLVSKLAAPARGAGSVLRIPAEVEVDGKLVAKLELLVRIIPAVSTDTDDSAE